MRPFSIIMVGLIILILPFLVFAEGNKQNNIEQIIIIRHAEKPPLGLGQLTCQGLNRSLKLPNYLIHTFPNASFIFAPNPSIKAFEKHGDKKYHDYIRPLATIEPTAIRLEMPVNVQIGYNDPKKLVNTLLENKYHNATIYVAWEHMYIMKITKLLLKHFHNKNKIPNWSNNNYNMVFVFTIHWNHPNDMKFTVRSENISNLSKKCPYS